MHHIACMPKARGGLKPTLLTTHSCHPGTAHTTQSAQSTHSNVNMCKALSNSSPCALVTLAQHTAYVASYAQRCWSDLTLLLSHSAAGRLFSQLVCNPSPEPEVSRQFWPLSSALLGCPLLPTRFQGHVSTATVRDHGREFPGCRLLHWSQPDHWSQPQSRFCPGCTPWS
jgi:hypothetical protein